MMSYRHFGNIVDICANHAINILLVLIASE